MRTLPPRLPDNGDPEAGYATKVIEHLKDVTDNDNSHRIERFSIWERVRLMVQNFQWLEPDYTDDPTRTPFWKTMEVDETNFIPMPVQNEMIAPLQNETARLLGTGSRPFVKASEDTPNLQRAAKRSKDVLLDTLRIIHWPEKEHRWAQSMSYFGTGIIKTYWNIDFSKTIRTPVRSAVRCPDCMMAFAHPRVPMAKAPELVDNPRMQGRFRGGQTVTDPNNRFMAPKVTRAEVTHCLACQEDPGEPPLVDELSGVELDPGRPGKPVPKLVPFVPNEKERKGGTDYFGRPLGQDTPIGEPGLDVLSLYDAFPENGGLDVAVDEITEMGEARVRSLDWIVNHFPHNGGEVKAESSSELMRWHPILGASRHYLAQTDKNLFNNHSLVREWNKQPWVELSEDEATGKKVPKLNRGRSIVVAGLVVLMDDDFMIDCHDKDGQPTGELIPRVQYQIVPWEVREKEIFGLGAGELIIPQQVTINTMLAQVQDARHRNGSPKLLCKEGMDLQYAGFTDTGYQSDVYYYRAEGDEKPEPFGNQQMTQEWLQEYSVYLDSINRAVGAQDAETGKVPNDSKSEWSAQALMYLGEKSSERRRNRIDRMREAKKRAYRHLLQLIQEKVREDRDYRVFRTTNERLTVRKFKGLDLAGQNDVEFDDEPAYDTRMVRRAAVTEGLDRGTIIADTDLARRKINRELGAPLDINEDKNKQIERAIDEWCLFYDDGKDPAVDRRGDAHLLHFQQHMLDLMGEEAEQLLEGIDWNQIELALWGWNDDFDALMAAEADLRANPLTPEPIIPKAPDGSVIPEIAQQAVAMWEQRKAIAEKIAAMPRALELRIFEFQKTWLDDQQIFATSVVQTPMGPQPTAINLERQKKVHRILRFKAHAEAHYREAMTQSAQAGVGAAIPAPAGAPETAAGMVPGGAGSAIAAPGGGPGATTMSGSGGPV